MKEDSLQESCVKWFTYKYENTGLGMIVHVPNGGSRNIAEGAKFKRIGTKAGFPDLIIFKKGSERVLFIEMKTEAKHSKLSDKQVDMHRKLKSFGQVVFVCRGLDSFMLVVENWFNNIY